MLREHFRVEIATLFLDRANELLDNLLLVNLHMDYALGLLARKLVLLDFL